MTSRFLSNFMSECAALLNQSSEHRWLDGFNMCACLPTNTGCPGISNMNMEGQIWNLMEIEHVKEVSVEVR